MQIKGKLLRGKEGIEISSVEMYVKKKVGGYNVLAALYSKGKSLNVETEITDLPNNIRIITLNVRLFSAVFEVSNASFFSFSDSDQFNIALVRIISVHSEFSLV